MGTPELFPGESEIREKVLGAGWAETIGNGWALVFASPDDENLTLRIYPSFFLEGVTPAFLLVETLDGAPARAPIGLQVWVSAGDVLRVPTIRDTSGICREKASCAGWATSCPRT